MKLKTIFTVEISIVRNCYLKIISRKRYKCALLNSSEFPAHITIHKGGFLSVGNHLSSLKRLRISVLPNASCVIGDNVNFNYDCMVICRNKIKIGSDCIFGPGCKIYDHDHDYMLTGTARRTHFVKGEVSIGSGVWFGANCIVLKNTRIGDNCVFGAGSIIHGDYPNNTLVVQDITEKRKVIDLN